MDFIKLLARKLGAGVKSCRAQLTLLVLLLAASALNAQTRTTVTGTVVDTEGTEVIGATVQIVGEEGRGTATNLDGEFTLTNVPTNATLRISYIGMQTQDVPLQGRTTLRIVLQSDSELLDEVVVVGYGTQKKANLTGAVSTVDLSNTLQGRPQQDVSKALQGAVPGLTITTSSGEINGDVSMRIRGVGTLSNQAVSNPLIVVDGVPMEDISFLNSQNIESISVLKDAASTSIYGTRAAFGVILIQTKGAQKVERTTLNYSNNFSWDQATYIPQYLDVPTQLRAALEGKANAGEYEVELFGMYFDKLLPYAEKWQKQNGKKRGYGEMRPYVDDNNVGDYILLGNTPYYYADWDVQNIFYNNAAPSQTHNISLQGSSGKTNYFLSLGYNDKEGVLKIRPDKLQKYNVSVNVNTQVFNWLTTGARVNFVRQQYQRPDTWNRTYQYLWRWGSFFIPSGTINGLDTRVIAMLKQASMRRSTTDYTRLSTFAKADIFEGLTLNADFSYSIQNMNSGSEDFSVYGINWGGVAPKYIVSPSSTAIWRDNSKQNTWTVNAYLNYERTFGEDHNFKLMAGVNAEEEDYIYLRGNRNGLFDEKLPELNLASQEGQGLNWAHNTRASAGYFGRINYDYKGIYLLELNARYDGSSRFPKHAHWAFFPSISAGYRFSEEDYFEPIRDYVSNAKIRGSFGEIGNEAIGNYMFEELISQISPENVYWVDANAENANKIVMYQMPDLVASSLTWERIRTTNIGIDLGFLRNELTLSFDWFQRENRDMLAPAEVLPDVLGASAPYQNAGTLRTRGWELNVNWHRTFGEFDFYTSFNLSDSKTVVTEWRNDTKLLNSYYSGKTYGDIWGFETDRYFEVADFTGQNPDGSWNYVAGIASQKGLEQGSFHYGPGDIKFKDLNGDGVIDGGKGTADDHGDLKVIGNFLPRYEYSFHIGGAWRGFDLDLFFQGVGKRDAWTVSSMNFPLMRNADLATYAHQNSYNKVLYEADYKTVKGYEIDQSNKYPRLFPGNDPSGTVSGINAGRNNYYPQTRYLTDMSYLRLKNVTLGYTLPDELSKRAWLQKARVYFSGSNLLLLHKGHDLPVDPEVSTGEGEAYGGWGRTAPITRTYSVGVQLTF